MEVPRSRRQRSGPTITDVASYAGVSPMTVSRVINGGAGVSIAKREVVHAAISDLDYVPSAAAQHLAGGHGIHLALLYSNPSSAYMSEFLMGSLDRTSSLNLRLSVEKFDDLTNVEAFMAHLLRGKVNGVVLPPPLCDSDLVIAVLREAKIPFVTVAVGVPRADVSTVAIDDFAAARAMTAHLLALGHRRIGFIKGNPDQSASERRYAGYLSALHEAGIAPDSALIAQGYFTYRSGLEAATQILDNAITPTAIFASNDDMAAAAVAVAHRRHLDVPRDLSICGFDDTPMATTIWPELTTIRQPVRDMAQAAIDLLVTDLRARRRGKNEVRHRQFDFALVRRDSDAVPRSGL